MSRGNPSADSLSSFFDSKLRLVDSAQSTHGASFPGGAAALPASQPVSQLDKRQQQRMSMSSKQQQVTVCSVMR
jgi:hypothetical protein